MKKIILSAIVVISFAACNPSDSEQGIVPTKSQITFNPTISSMTRVANNAFEVGDEIRVSAYENGSEYASNVSYVYTGTTFISSTPIEYTSSEQQVVFRAVYPAVENMSESFNFTVNTDQTSASNYEASDLLTSQTSATSDLCPTLSFSHKMTSIVLNIAGDKSGVVTLMAKNNASCNIESNSYEATGEATTIKPMDNGNAGVKVIIVPQSFSTGSLVATYVVDGMTYTWDAPKDLTFESNKEYVYNWDLADRSVTLESVINGWGNGEGGTIIPTTTEVTFNPTILSMTRVAENVFNTGDEIRVSAFENGSKYVSNVSYIYSGTKFISGTPIQYSSLDQQMVYQAVYPAIDNTSETFNFTIKTDQSSASNYEASDLLTSQTSVTSERCPTLLFSHRMTSIVLNIIGKKSGVVTLTAKNNTSCHIGSNSYEATGEATSIKPLINGNSGVKAIIAPQLFLAGSTIASYVVDGETYTWTIPENLTFESNKEYVYNWNLSENSVILEGVINGWGTGEGGTIVSE